MKPKPFEIIVEFTPQSNKTGITYEAHQKGSLIRCKDCAYSEHWTYDKRRCFLWSEDGISVFDNGFCNYAERKVTE